MWRNSSCNTWPESLWALRPAGCVQPIPAQLKFVSFQNKTAPRKLLTGGGLCLLLTPELCLRMVETRPVAIWIIQQSLIDFQHPCKGVPLQQVPYRRDPGHNQLASSAKYGKGKGWEAAFTTITAGQAWAVRVHETQCSWQCPYGVLGWLYLITPLPGTERMIWMSFAFEFPQFIWAWGM